MNEKLGITQMDWSVGTHAITVQTINIVDEHLKVSRLGHL